MLESFVDCQESFQETETFIIIHDYQNSFENQLVAVKELADFVFDLDCLIEMFDNLNFELHFPDIPVVGQNLQVVAYYKYQLALHFDNFDSDTNDKPVVVQCCFTVISQVCYY